MATSKPKTAAIAVSKSSKFPSKPLASHDQPARKLTRKRVNPKIHIREKPPKDSPTLCGGSHSPIWNRDGQRPLESVGPQQAAKATCGRCLRVSKSREENA